MNESQATRIWIEQGDRVMKVLRSSAVGNAQTNLVARDLDALKDAGAPSGTLAVVASSRIESIIASGNKDLALNPWMSGFRTSVSRASHNQQVGR